MTTFPAIPLDQERIEAVPVDEVAALVLSGKADSVLLSTACWRQYIGKWRISGGRLYIVSLQGIYRLKGEEPLFAEWFTGLLSVPRGRCLQYVHMGVESVYEAMTLITVKEGVVTDIKYINQAPAENPPNPRLPCS